MLHTLKVSKRKVLCDFLIDLSWLAKVNLNRFLAPYLTFSVKRWNFSSDFSAFSQYWADTLLEELSAEKQSKLKNFFSHLSTFLIRYKIVYFSLKAKVKEFPSISAFRKQWPGQKLGSAGEVRDHIEIDIYTYLNNNLCMEKFPRPPGP